MRKIDYQLSRTLLQMTGIVFFTQIVLDMVGFVERTPGMEWIIWATGILFILSLVYAVGLVLWNAYASKKMRENV